MATTSLEITVLSAEGIINTATPFPLPFFSPCRRLRTFITITTSPPPLTAAGKCAGVYTTRVDDEGGPNPNWGDKFLLPLHPTFFTSSSNSSSFLFLHLYTKRALLGRALLGWAQIPATDILDGPLSVGSARHLSYRIRARDGSRGHAVVNIALRLISGKIPVVGSSGGCGHVDMAVADRWRPAIGVPVPVDKCLMT